MDVIPSSCHVFSCCCFCFEIRLKCSTIRNTAVHVSRYTGITDIRRTYLLFPSVKKQIFSPIRNCMTHLLCSNRYEMSFVKYGRFSSYTS